MVDDCRSPKLQGFVDSILRLAANDPKLPVAKLVRSLWKGVYPRRTQRGNSTGFAGVRVSNPQTGPCLISKSFPVPSFFCLHQCYLKIGRAESSAPIEKHLGHSVKTQIAGEPRDLALFDLAIDSKLRACDLT